MLQYIHLNIVRSNTISLIFIKINILQFFFLQNCSKIHSRTHQIAPFFKKFSGEHAPEPPSKRMASPRSAYGTKRYANRLTFLKIILNPHPPPPGNETLETPLSQIMLVNSIYPHNKYIFFFLLLCTYPN